MVSQQLGSRRIRRWWIYPSPISKIHARGKLCGAWTWSLQEQRIWWCPLMWQLWHRAWRLILQSFTHSPPHQWHHDQALICTKTKTCQYRFATQLPLQLKLKCLMQYLLWCASCLLSRAQASKALRLAAAWTLFGEQRFYDVAILIDVLHPARSFCL